jgi:hypothetical protein
VRSGVECDSCCFKVLVFVGRRAEGDGGELFPPHPAVDLDFWTCIASPARITICMQHSRPNKESITVV